MIRFKRLPSDILPVADGNNVVLAETSSGDCVLIDSDGAKTLGTKLDISAAIAEMSDRVRDELAQKTDISTVRALAEQYNEAIKVINDLSERLAALESNYDPTIIK